MSSDEEELFEVDSVIDSRIQDGVVQFRVRWLNFSPKHDTWEPEENLLTCHDLIERYLLEKNRSDTQNPSTNVGNTAATVDGEASNLFANLNNEIQNLSMNKKADDLLNRGNLADRNLDIDDESYADSVASSSSPPPPPLNAATSGGGNSNAGSPRKKRAKRELRWEWAELRDPFWKELEAGKVDLSTGLYERVKRKRQCNVSQAPTNDLAPIADNAVVSSPKPRQTRSSRLRLVSDENDNSPKRLLENHLNAFTTDGEDLLLLENNENDCFNAHEMLLNTARPNGDANGVMHVSNDQIDQIIDSVISGKIDNNEKRFIKVEQSSVINENIESSLVHVESVHKSTLATPAQVQCSSKLTLLAKLDKIDNEDDKLGSNSKKVVQNITDSTTSSANKIALVDSESGIATNIPICSNLIIKLEPLNLEVLSNKSIEPVNASEIVPNEQPVVSSCSADSPAVTSCLEAAELVKESTHVTCVENNAIASESNTLETQKSSHVKAQIPVLPPGRWLPLMPRLVKPAEIEHIPGILEHEPILTGIEQEAILAASLPVVSYPLQFQSAEKEYNGKSKKSESPKKNFNCNFIFPIPIEENFSLQDYFKVNMQQLQEEERINARLFPPDQFYDACRNGCFDVVRLALRASKQFHYSYDYETIDSKGNTLLMCATLKKCDPCHFPDDVVEILVQCGANINAYNQDGDTALMLAIAGELLCKVTKLLSLGAAVNLPNSNGETPLMVACRKGFPMVAQRLLEYGADFNALTTSGESVAYVAAQNKAVAKVLQLHEAKVKQSFDQSLMGVLEPEKFHFKQILFPVHCYAINESKTFRIMFDYTNRTLWPTSCFTILCIAVAKFGAQNVVVRFWGPSPVVSVVVNEVTQYPLQEEGRFIFTLAPLKVGKNEVLINCSDNYKMSQCKLLTSGFIVQTIM